MASDTWVYTKTVYNNTAHFKKYFSDGTSETIATGGAFDSTFFPDTLQDTYGDRTVQDPEGNFRILYRDYGDGTRLKMMVRDTAATVIGTLDIDAADAVINSSRRAVGRVSFDNDGNMYIATTAQYGTVDSGYLMLTMYKVTGSAGAYSIAWRESYIVLVSALANNEPPHALYDKTNDRLFLVTLQGSWPTNEVLIRIDPATGAEVHRHERFLSAVDPAINERLTAPEFCCMTDSGRLVILGDDYRDMSLNISTHVYVFQDLGGDVGGGNSVTLERHLQLDSHAVLGSTSFNKLPYYGIECVGGEHVVAYGYQQRLDSVDTSEITYRPLLAKLDASTDTNTISWQLNAPFTLGNSVGEYQYRSFAWNSAGEYFVTGHTRQYAALNTYGTEALDFQAYDGTTGSEIVPANLPTPGVGYITMGLVFAPMASTPLPPTEPEGPGGLFWQSFPTAMDGLDLGIMPTRFRMDPVERSSRSSGIMGNVHFLWPKWKRTMYLTLIYEDLRTEEAQTLLGAFGPRTPHNKVLSLNLNRPEQVFWIPGGVNMDLDYSDKTGRWNLEFSTHAMVYDETGDFIVRTKLFDLPTTQDVVFAVYRYEHLYILQSNQNLTVIDPDGNLTTSTLAFMPNTWASFGGTVYFYRDLQDEAGTNPGGPFGIIEYIGVNSDLSETHATEHYRVYRDVIVRGTTVIRDPYEGVNFGTMDTSYLSVNGLPYEYSTASIEGYTTHTRAFDVIGKTFFKSVADGTSIPDKPIFAHYENNGYLLFFQDDGRISYYNGSEGKMLFASELVIYDHMVPYMLPENGLLAVGYSGGYFFSPDMGISWRKRKLNGWGVVTESGVLTVSATDGIIVEQGSW